MARRYGSSDTTLGGKLGPKIALLVGQVMHDHIRRTASHRADIGAQAAVRFFQTISAERDTHWQPLFEYLLGHEGMHPEFEKVLRFASKGKGEGSSLSALSMIGGIGTSTLSQAMGYALAPWVQAVAYGHRYTLLDPATAASSAARNFQSEDEAYKEGGWQGMTDSRMFKLLEMARSRPAPDMLLQLLRRGVIPQQQYFQEMQMQGFTQEAAVNIEHLATSLLSPEDLALMVLKGIKAEDAVRHEAAMSGINAERLHDLILMSGEPPGLEQLQEFYRRGFIDDQRFIHGVRESRVKDEWTDVLLKARFQRASPSDALRGVIQNHISDAEGKQIAEEGGLMPKDWKWLVETEGNPAADMQMISLWRRGKASQQQVEQAIRESRVKNKYVPLLLNYKRAIPSLFQINKLLTAGSISPHEGARLLHELGYENDVIPGILHSAGHAAVVKEKTLAKAEVEELLYGRAIDEARATRMFAALGYNPANAKLLILFVNLRREKALRQAAISPIRAAYVARHIDEAEASKRLDQLGIRHEERDFALKQWAVDRQVHTKTLTEAQIVKANERGLISDHDAEQRLLDEGYTLGDARILLDLEKPRKHPAP